MIRKKDTPSRIGVAQARDEKQTASAFGVQARTTGDGARITDYSSTIAGIRAAFR
jgi:hypothetical protein